MWPKKYFKLSFTEFNGEHEYIYVYLIAASTEKQADKIGRKFVKGWYDGGKKMNGCDDYEYDYNDNICRYHGVYETTLEEFTHNLVQRFTV